MSASQSLSTSISITGNVTSEFLKASGVSLAAFQKLQNKLKEVETIQQKVSRGFTEIAKIASGVALGELMFKGFEKGIGMVDSLIGKFKEMGKYSSEEASKFEVIRRGMGALLSNQNAADTILGNLRSTANASPFEPNSLYGVAREFTGRGMPKEMLESRTGEMGDIASGLGGSKDVLDRLTLAYGEAYDQKTFDNRILRQFSEAGVPLTEAMMDVMGLKPDQIQQFLKAVHDKTVGFDILDKAIYGLTHGGLFTDGMKNFASTYIGILTTFTGQLKGTAIAVGDIVNDISGGFLKLVNANGYWQEIGEWLQSMRHIEQNVQSFVQSIGNSGVSDKLQMFFDDIQNKFNHWMGGFFKEIHNPATGDIEQVLNETGMEKIQKIIDGLTGMMKGFADFLTSDSVKTLESVAWDVLPTVAHNLGYMVQLMTDAMAFNGGALMHDMAEQSKWIDSQNANSRAADRLKNWAPPDTSPQHSEYNGTSAGTPGAVGALLSQGRGYNASWDDYLQSVESKYGLRSGTLRAIGRQENVAAGDMNPLGISPNGGGPTHFSDEGEARRAIDRQARLMIDPKGPYGDIRTKSVKEWSKIYSPPGAANDPYGTNSTEDSGIEANMRKLNKPTTQVNVNLTIHALDHVGVAQVIQDNAHHIHRAVMDAQSQSWSQQAVV
jgi:hypothetical protein